MFFSILHILKQKESCNYYYLHFAEFQKLCEKKENFEFFRQLADIQKPSSPETSENRTIQDIFCCRRARTNQVSTSGHEEKGNEKVLVKSDTDDEDFENTPLL